MICSDATSSRLESIVLVNTCGLSKDCLLTMALERLPRLRHVTLNGTDVLLNRANI
jgi:hypothetical protein